MVSERIAEHYGVGCGYVIRTHHKAALIGLILGIYYFNSENKTYDSRKQKVYHSM